MELAFVTEVMRALVAGDVSYIETTVTQLRDQTHAAWAVSYTHLTLPTKRIV